MFKVKNNKFVHDAMVKQVDMMFPTEMRDAVKASIANCRGVGEFLKITKHANFSIVSDRVLFFSSLFSMYYMECYGISYRYIYIQLHRILESFPKIKTGYGTGDIKHFNYNILKILFYLLI